jgi:hypothetical protein
MKANVARGFDRDGRQTRRGDGLVLEKRFNRRTHAADDAQYRLAALEGMRDYIDRL